MDVRDIQRSLLRVVERARRIDIRRYEWREDILLHHELLPAIEQVLSDAINIFTRILEYYGSPFDHDAADPVASSADPRVGGGADQCGGAGHDAGRITDLAFMANWELHREREELTQIGFGEEAWTIVSQCSRACRRLITSAIAIENAICAREDLRSVLDSLYRTELNRSLQIRRVYAVFRHAIAGSGPSTPENVRERLRGAAIGIAQLVGSDIYGHLRSADRMRIETLRGRLTEWLSANRDGEVVAGRRLWQEIKNIAELLLEVNKRAELQEHDQAVAAEVHFRLFQSASAPDGIPQDLQLRLESLFGRDEELDQLIVDAASRPVTDWRRPLERILEHFSPNRPLLSPDTHFP